MAGIVSSALGLKPRKRRDLGAKAHFLVAQPLELERVGSTDSFKSVRRVAEAESASAEPVQAI